MATENEEVVIIEEAPTGEALPGTEESVKSKEAEGDERLGSEEGAAEDEVAAGAETAEEAEARRERNRKRRADNKTHRKDYIDSLKREIAARDEILADALTRLGEVEKRNNSSDVAAVDSELKKTADAYGYFKGQLEMAVKEQNGAAAAEATEKMAVARSKFDHLNNIKKAVSQQSQQAAPLDPRLRANAEAWVGRNAWYDPTLRDQDSKVTKMLDDSLVQEGWNPTTTQYWEELDARIKKYLPHRTKQAHNSGQRSNSSPVAGSGRESSGASSNAVSYTLSAARVQAMKDSGAYDDPKRRADMIKRYQQADKDAAAAARN